VPIGEGRQLYEHYAGPKDSYWVEGAQHYDLRRHNKEEYLNRLRTFLEGGLNLARAESGVPSHAREPARQEPHAAGANLEPLGDRQVTAFALRHAEAKAVAKKLSDVFCKEADLRIVSEETTNTVFVTGRKEKVKVLRALLDRIDANRQLCYITLKNLDPAMTSKALSTILGQDALVNVAGKNGKTIFIIGSDEMIEQARKFLNQLDAEDRETR
jgi:hypothetical protein